jgi:hypothetical protein
MRTTLTLRCRELLRILVEHLPKVDANEEKTYIGYKQVHDQLGIPQVGPWGRSLQKQGLTELAKWLTESDLPAIDGLVVAKSKSYRPGTGFSKGPRQLMGEKVWKEEILKAKEMDWSPFLEGSVRDTKIQAPLDGHGATKHRDAVDREEARLFGLIDMRAIQSGQRRELMAGVRTVSSDVRAWLRQELSKDPLNCALCRGRMSIEGANDLLKPSIDRLDSACIEYKPSNVQLTHYACNLAKNCFDKEKFEEWMSVLRGK